MDLRDILPAVDSVRERMLPRDSRAATYLRTYPSIRALGSAPGQIDAARFHQVAAMAYGWMPRVLRLEPHYVEKAAIALMQAQAATTATFANVPIGDLQKCLHSIVGASKVLHFTNPEVFPIWDKRVESFRLRGEPSQYHMDELSHYVAYATEVHQIRRDPEFRMFYAAFTDALGVRLRALEVSAYPISEVRAIEAAAFELANDETDDA